MTIQEAEAMMAQLTQEQRKTYDIAMSAFSEQCDLETQIEEMKEKLKDLQDDLETARWYAARKDADVTLPEGVTRLQMARANKTLCLARMSELVEKHGLK